MDKRLIIFTDGGARGNPGPAASGVVIDGLAGKERLICGKYLGETTNNVAEYTAVLLALETALKETGSQAQDYQINFFTDSLLVAKQLSGVYKIKNENLRKIIVEIKKLEQSFALVTYQHVPRERNREADREVNRILDQNEVV